MSDYIETIDSLRVKHEKQQDHIKKQWMAYLIPIDDGGNTGD